MNLAERHIIKKGNSVYMEIDSTSFLSKNLYNKANYIIRQEYINNGVYINYNELQKRLQNENDFDYRGLPTKISQQILMGVNENWKNFFKAHKDWQKHPDKYKAEPQIPKYKHKQKGRNLLTYTIQAISRPELKKGIIKLSGTNITLKTKQTSIQQVRIVPKIGYYVIEIIYKKEVTQANVNKEKIAGIDTGVVNLATITSNQKGIQPLLINGRPLKSMNQYYNKKRAKLQAYVANGTSNKLVKLTNKRNLKIHNYMHNASRNIVNWLVANEIGTLVIGKNKFWKHKVSMGNERNQEFAFIPIARFINMIEYKCELVGIDVIINDEHYTSVCSFIDNESVEKHEKYLGKRKKRGLFVSKDKIKINADCNGSGNIIRKAFPNAFADGIEGVVGRPIRLTPYKLVA